VNYCIVESVNWPVNGDKFTTQHGQKAVIKIVRDDEMPFAGKRRAELVIGSASVIKRDTPSQLFEAAVSMYAMEHMKHNEFPYTVDDVLETA
jgi:DNA-directed RNA polymerase beta subunit